MVNKAQLYRDREKVLVLIGRTGQQQPPTDLAATTFSRAQGTFAEVHQYCQRES
jgi:hypothetical protein